RDNLKILLEDLNNQKKILKDNGIDVDDKLYQVQFVVIVDYKTLTLLLVKKDEEDFLVGGRGVSVEFCLIYNAVRVFVLAMQF
ncbi:uncharacterized protein LOC113672090, partial [Pocillopora damicornis]|uniref:uncharacterized protein LOC113672090 n=1 Tax=Pocillopora damicornis TaxID=46731 RepID=UPI000F551781